MEYTAFIEFIRRDGAAFGDIARAGDPAAPVPSCPDWTLLDVVSHQGRLFRWVSDIIATRPADPLGHWSKLAEPTADDWIEWWDVSRHLFVDVLESAGADDDVWTWTTDRRVRFWARRQAQELAVHGWDVRGAQGDPTPIDRDIAIDGINEFFEILPYRKGHEQLQGQGQTMHLHCTDGEGEWMVRRNPDALVVTHEHGKGDVAARGTASDLLLLLWGRVETGAFEVFGDASLLEDWQARARF